MIVVERFEILTIAYVKLDEVSRIFTITTVSSRYILSLCIVWSCAKVYPSVFRFAFDVASNLCNLNGVKIDLHAFNV